MKVCITKITDITGKDGREWTKLDFVQESGETGTIIYEKGKYKVNENDFSLVSFSSVEFDQRGRLVSAE